MNELQKRENLFEGFMSGLFFCQNASLYYVGYGLGFERTICEAFKCQVRS